MAMLTAAEKAGRLGELDWVCRGRAVEAAIAARFDRRVAWFVNVESAAVAVQRPPGMLHSWALARRDLHIVAEMVERGIESHLPDLLVAADRARRNSWGVAIDDVGAVESSLALLPVFGPDVVKLDISLVRGAPDGAAAATAAAVRDYSERTGAVILAEGIETPRQRRRAQVFGATYGQGYLFGRPGPLPRRLPPPAYPVRLLQPLEQLGGRTPFELLTGRLGPPARARKADLLHISRRLESESTGAAAVLLACFQRSSFFTGTTARRYRRLADANALTVVLGDGLHPSVEPNLRIGPLPARSRMSGEWVVIMMTPHYAAAFVARDCGDPGPDGERRFDYHYTHDRNAVIHAARAFLQEA